MLSVDSDFVLKLAHVPLVTKVDYGTGQCPLLFRARIFDASEEKRKAKGCELLDALYGKTVEDAKIYGGFAGSDFMKVFGVGAGFAKSMVRKGAAREEWITGAVGRNVEAVNKARVRLARKSLPVGSGRGAQAPDGQPPAAPPAPTSRREIESMLDAHTKSFTDAVYYDIKERRDKTLSGHDETHCAPQALCPDLEATVRLSAIRADPGGRNWTQRVTRTIFWSVNTRASPPPRCTRCSHTG